MPRPRYNCVGAPITDFLLCCNFFLAALLRSRPAKADNDPQLTGHVHDPHGLPIFGAEVRLRPAEASRVLVVPVLISVGHIQKQIHERLKGLSYTMSETGLAEHPLAAEWIQQQTSALQRVAAVRIR